jgi:hypothetical protein
MKLGKPDGLSGASGMVGVENCAGEALREMSG